MKHIQGQLFSNRLGYTLFLEKKGLFTLLIGGMIWLLSMQSAWAQSTAAVPMLEHAANQIIATLKQNQSRLKTDHAIIYQAIQQHLLPHVDLQGMARSVLGRQAWAKATADEKREFTQVFTKLVVRTYASPLAEYTGETVKFQPLRSEPNARFLRVNSQLIRPNGQTIPLSYQLVSMNGSWKIYDLNVEGVSLLQSFRSQFAGVLQNASMRDLIAQMKQRQQEA